MSTTRWYERWDGSLLVRERHEGAVHEVFGPGEPHWRPFPQADPLHWLEPISAERALEMARGDHRDSITMTHLESAADAAGFPPVLAKRER